MLLMRAGGSPLYFYSHVKISHSSSKLVHGTMWAFHPNTFTHLFSTSTELLCTSLFVVFGIFSSVCVRETVLMMSSSHSMASLDDVVARAQKQRHDSAGTPLCPPCVIFINGFPGVGKNAVAKALQARLCDQAVRYIPHHLLDDPVEAISPDRARETRGFRRQLRMLAFDALVAQPDPELVIIMTGCIASNAADIALFHDYVSIARRKNVPFYSFNLECDLFVHIHRLQSNPRMSSKRKRITDPTILRNIIAQTSLIKHGDYHGHNVARLSVIRSTYMQAEDTASEMLRQIGEATVRRAENEKHLERQSVEQRSVTSEEVSI